MKAVGMNVCGNMSILQGLNEAEVIFEHKENAGAYYQRVYQIFQEAEKQNLGLRVG